VILAGDQPRAVLQLHEERRLDARPLVEDLGRREPSIGTLADRPVHHVPYRKVGHSLEAPVGHENARVARDAVRARMAATPVRIDRPAERHPRLLGNAVEDRARTHLVEAGVEGLWRIEMPNHRVLGIAGQPVPLFLLDREVAPAHEHMFAYAHDGCLLARDQAVPIALRLARDQPQVPRGRA
jgi:hypothetical protein